eukprot:5700155-Pleurochrysis_carterae.AAC.1
MRPRARPHATHRTAAQRTQRNPVTLGQRAQEPHAGLRTFARCVGARHTHEGGVRAARARGAHAA